MIFDLFQTTQAVPLTVKSRAYAPVVDIFKSASPETIATTFTGSVKSTTQKIAVHVLKLQRLLVVQITEGATLSILLMLIFLFTLFPAASVNAIVSVAFAEYAFV